MSAPASALDVKFWQYNHFDSFAAAGEVEPRPGILALFDSARKAGLKVGVCSAATKSSAICVLENLLGADRFRVGPSASVTVPQSAQQMGHDVCPGDEGMSEALPGKHAEI